MAEVVQRHLEEMLLEFEQSKRIGLFNEQEIKKIIRTRKRHEYKIIRRTKEKECYLDYIKYENHLLQLIKMRREKLKLGITHKKNEIDLAIKRRIERLFRSACHRFKKDIQLWLTFIEFLKKQYDYSTASSVYLSALQIHSNKHWLWILAAKFEFEVMVSPSSARALFQRALRLMPKCKQLWIEYFKLELLYVELIEKRRAVLDGNRKDKTDDENSDAILEGKIIEVVLNNAQESIPDDPEFLCSFASILYEFRQFSFVEEIVNKIYRILEEKYSSDVLSQNLLAQRPLLKEKQMIEEASKKGQDISFMIAVLERQVHENYENFLSTSNNEKLWNSYIDFCYKRLKEDELVLLKDERLSVYYQTLTKAEQKFLLPSDRYLQWVMLLEENNLVEKANEVIRRATNDKHKDNVLLWNERLRLLLIKTETIPVNLAIVKEEFLLSMKHLKNKNSSIIWDTVLDYAKAHSKEWTEELYQLSQSGSMDLSISLHTKSSYLQWINQTKSIKHVRKLFDKLSTQMPASLQFYLDYIEIEQSQKMPIQKDRLSNAFEQAIIYFGKTSADLWLRYIEYLKRHQTLDFLSISRVYNRALHTLESNEFTHFKNHSTVSNLTADNQDL